MRNPIISISRIAKFTTIASAALCISLSTIAVSQEKETPPVGGEPHSFALPSIESYTLDNGTQVTLVPFGRVPKVTVRAVVRVGNLNDGEQTWIADLTGALMEEGAGGKSASEMAALAANMGGDLNIGIGLDEARVAMDVLSESAGASVRLIADVLQRPNFPESEVQRKKDDLIRNVTVARTRAGAQANEAFSAILYPDHPYGDTLPDDGQLESYDLDDVKAFYNANFGGARTHIYVVGQYDQAEIKGEIKAAFADWKTGEPPLILSSVANETPEIKLIDRPDAPQSTIRLGKRVPALDNSVALEAADTILGGYFSSRITRNIREDKGYTYSPNSFVNANYKTANWQQNADISSESTGPALHEIFKEIKTLQNEAPSDTELQGIKNYMNGIFVLQLASRGGMAGRLAYVNLHELGTKYLEGFVANVGKLTPEDLQNAAQTHLDIDDMSLVVVGPLDTVRGQLEALPEITDRLPE